MPVLSLKDRIDWLERELPPNVPRFKIYDDLPFAILRYDPEEEWELRREVRHLRTRLSNAGCKVDLISLADLLWKAIDETEGMRALVELETTQGFAAAQRQVSTYLSDDDFCPLPRMLDEELRRLDPERSIAFLVRAAAMGPSIYYLSQLLEQMQGRTRVPAVLFFPGHMQGMNTLSFMGLPEREPHGNYRVKIYG
jgi:hypothetical protein